MIKIDELTNEQKQQYFRIMGPAIATNNIAKNCLSIMAFDGMHIRDDLHLQIAHRLTTAIDCLKNCCELNDTLIEKATEKFISEYKEKPVITEVKTRDDDKKKECKK